MPVFAVSVEHAGNGLRRLRGALGLHISWETEIIPLLEVSAGTVLG